MKKATILVTAAAFAAAMAAPVAANNVPLNNVSGGEGKEIVTGQGGLTTGAALVGALSVIVLVAAGDDSTASTAVAE